ncbi:MAG: hypothetical protein RR840_05765 [Clostridium sp.]
MRSLRCRGIITSLIVVALVLGVVGSYIIYIFSRTVSEDGIEADIKIRLGANSSVVERVNSRGEVFALVKESNKPGMKLIIYKANQLFGSRYEYVLENFYTNDTRARSQDFGVYNVIDYIDNGYENLYVIYGDNSIIKAATVEIISEDGKIQKTLPEAQGFLYVFRSYNGDLLGNSFLDSGGNVIE